MGLRNVACIMYIKLLIQYIKLSIQYTINWVALVIPTSSPMYFVFCILYCGGARTNVPGGPYGNIFKRARLRTTTLLTKKYIIGGLTVWWFHLYIKNRKPHLFFCHGDHALLCFDDEFRFFRFLFSIFMSDTFQFVSVNIT